MADAEKQTSNSELPVSINREGTTGVSFRKFSLNSLFYPDLAGGQKLNAVYVRLESDNIVKIDKDGNLTSTSSSWGAKKELVSHFHKQAGTTELTVGQPFEYTFDAEGKIYSYRVGPKYGEVSQNQFAYAPERVMEIVAVQEPTDQAEAKKVDTAGRSTSIVSEFEKTIAEIITLAQKNAATLSPTSNVKIASEYILEAQKIQKLCNGDPTLDYVQKKRMLCLVNVFDQASLLAEHNKDDTTGAINGATKRGIDLFYERDEIGLRDMNAELNSKSLRAVELLKNNPQLAFAVTDEFIKASSQKEEERQQILFVAKAPAQWESESTIAQRREQELRQARSANTRSCIEIFRMLQDIAAGKI